MHLKIAHFPYVNKTRAKSEDRENKYKRNEEEDGTVDGI